MLFRSLLVLFIHQLLTYATYLGIFLLPSSAVVLIRSYEITINSHFLLLFELHLFTCGFHSIQFSASLHTFHPTIQAFFLHLTSWNLLSLCLGIIFWEILLLLYVAKNNCSISCVIVTKLFGCQALPIMHPVTFKPLT